MIDGLERDNWYRMVEDESSQEAEIFHPGRKVGLVLEGWSTLTFGLEGGTVELRRARLTFGDGGHDVLLTNFSST